MDTFFSVATFMCEVQPDQQVLSFASSVCRVTLKARQYDKFPSRSTVSSSLRSYLKAHWGSSDIYIAGAHIYFNSDVLQQF